MTNFTYYYSETVSTFENSQGFQFFIHGLLGILLVTSLVLAFLWYESRDEMEDGNKVFNPMKFSQKIKNLCCFPESCQSSAAKCCIVLGVIGSSYLEVLQEEEAVRETRTLEKLMEARKAEKEKKRSRRSSKKSRSHRNSGENNEYMSDDGDSSVHSGVGLL